MVRYGSVLATTLVPSSTCGDSFHDNGGIMSFWVVLGSSFPLPWIDLVLPSFVVDFCDYCRRFLS